MLAILNIWSRLLTFHLTFCCIRTARSSVLRFLPFYFYDSRFFAGLWIDFGLDIYKFTIQVSQVLFEFIHLVRRLDRLNIAVTYFLLLLKPALSVLAILARYLIKGLHRSFDLNRGIRALVELI